MPVLTVPLFMASEVSLNVNSEVWYPRSHQRPQPSLVIVAIALRTSHWLSHVHVDPDKMAKDFRWIDYLV